MKTATCYKAFTDNRGADGRGPPNIKVIGYFVNLSDAEEAAKGQGEWGSNGEIEHVELTIFETFKEFLDHKEAEERKAALKKLTDREKRLLGLDI